MNIETVKYCWNLFEEMTGRQIKETEKKVIKISCVIGESYGLKKFVDAEKYKKNRSIERESD